ncbi:MAG: ChaN family lipoprotein [Myxococcota bacterium]|nr:ChaN family lipoprotein [Myxococcota bacterium]
MHTHPSFIFLRRRASYLVACIMAWSITACGPSQVKKTEQRTQPMTWTTSLFLDHPLVGQIWSSRERRMIGEQQLAQRLRSAPIILIGERHDHPDHHVIQGRILQALPAGVLVGFEMLNLRDTAVVAKANSPESVRTLTNWDQSGWPSFNIYAPVFKALFEGGHQPAAVHPDRAHVRQSMMGPNSQAHSIGAYEGVLSPRGVAALRKDIDLSHCGYAPAGLVNAMMLAQEFKDRVMIKHLMAPPGPKQRVLIAGNGHVRRDYGVPNHTDRSVISIGIMEVKPAQISPKDYGPHRYDYVWFTPRLDNLSPCEKYKKILEKMRVHHQKAPAKSSRSVAAPSPPKDEKSSAPKP